MNEPKDGRPDVVVSTSTWARAKDPMGVLQVQYEVFCRWCGGYRKTPDVRDAVTYADQHEASESHRLGKQERIDSGRGPMEND